MINAIYGKKIGMTQIFDDEDRIVPVTVIQAEPNTVCQVKTVDTDGYEAVQMGFGYIKPRRVNKPMQGHFDAQGAEPKRYLREVRVENAGEYKVGDEQTVAAFADVKKVDVTGTSKGKGFAGVMKRYGFAGGPGRPRRALPSRPRFRGPVRHAVPRVQGPAPAWPHGLRHRHREEPRGCSHRRGAEPHPGQGCGARRQERHRPRPHGLIGTIGNKELQQLWQLLRLRT